MKLFLLFLFTLFMTGDHKLTTVQELKIVLLEDGKSIEDADEQLRTNLAFVYFLNSGKVVLLPNDRLDKSLGLLFETRVAYDSCIRNDHFPVPEKETRVEDRYKQQILSVETNINYYVQEAASLIGYDLNKGDLKDLLVQLRKHNQKQYREKDYFFSVLVLGEFIRTAKNGKWTALKRYRNFNPYYTPTVTLPSGKVVILSNKMELFFNSQIAPENYLKHFIKN